MPRRTHRPEEEIKETVDGRIDVHLPPKLICFLDVDAKKRSEKTGRRITKVDIVRALIVAYYEKVVAGMLVDPDD